MLSPSFGLLIHLWFEFKGRRIGLSDSLRGESANRSLRAQPEHGVRTLSAQLKVNLNIEALGSGIFVPVESPLGLRLYPSDRARAPSELAPEFLWQRQKVLFF